MRRSTPLFLTPSVQPTWPQIFMPRGDVGSMILLIKCMGPPPAVGPTFGFTVNRNRPRRFASSGDISCSCDVLWMAIWTVGPGRAQQQPEGMRGTVCTT